MAGAAVVPATVSSSIIITYTSQLNLSVSMFVNLVWSLPTSMRATPGLNYHAGVSSTHLFYALLSVDDRALSNHAWLLNVMNLWCYTL
jgi:hypothetical protein